MAESTLMNSQIDLTILVPTYNRSEHVSKMIEFFVHLQPMMPTETKWELVFSDNCSPDNTKAVIDAASRSFDFIHRICPEKHLPTAEENLFSALKSVRGRYCWILGDDDRPKIDTVMHLMSRIRNENRDLLIFNSFCVSALTGVSTLRTDCSEPEIEMTMMDFIRRTGVWFVLAGFSTTVFKTSAIGEVDATASKWMSISKIYAHVFFLIEKFYAKNFVYVHRPLVSYQQNVSDVMPTGHWERGASREGVFARFFWTLGLVRQAKELYRLGIAKPGFFRDVIDQNAADRLNLLDQVLWSLCEQIESNEKFKGCRPMTLDEFEEIARFAITENPEYIDVLSTLRGALSATNSKMRRQLIANARSYLERDKNKGFLSMFYQTSTMGFEVFCLHDRWFAIPKGLSRAQVRSMTRDICLASSDELISAPTEEDLILKLKSLPERQTSKLSRRQSADSALSQFSDFSETEVSILKKIVAYYTRVKNIFPRSLRTQFSRWYWRDWRGTN